MPSADIFFEQVKIAPTDVLLPAGSFGKMMQAFCLERLGNATLALANAQAALDEGEARARRHTCERHARVDVLVSHRGTRTHGASDLT